MKDFFIKIWSGIKGASCAVVDFFKNRFIPFMKKTISWIGVGGLVCLETSAILILFFLGFLPILWAFLTTLILGVIKSIIDLRHGSHCEKHDLLCNVVGCVLGIMLSFWM